MTSSVRSFLRSVVSILMVTLAMPAIAHAATRNWSATPSNGNWSVAANWVEGIAPVAGDDLIFPAASTFKAMTNDLAAGIGLNSIAFNGNGYSIAGNGFTLGAAGVTCTTSTAPQTNSINVGITLGAASAFTLVTGCQLNVNGPISGPFGFAFTNGAMLLNGLNSFAGAVNANGGLIIVNSVTALGTSDGTPATGTTINSGAGLVINSGLSVVNEWLSLSGTGAPGSITGALYHTSPGSSWTGPIVLAADTRIGALNGLFTLSGPITGPGSLTKLDNGTLVIAGNSNYSGTTTVSAGGMRINANVTGSPTAAVGSNALFGGNGTFAGTVTTAGATIQPGNSPGLLNTGAATFTPASSFDVELNGTTPGTQYDQLNVTGAVTLGAGATTLSTTLGFVPAPGQQFVIINNDGSDPVVGAFLGLLEGASFVVSGTTFNITYAGGTGNDVVLTAAAVVPALPLPVLFALAALLMLAVTAAMRRQQLLG